MLDVEAHVVGRDGTARVADITLAEAGALPPVKAALLAALCLPGDTQDWVAETFDDDFEEWVDCDDVVTPAQLTKVFVFAGADIPAVLLSSPTPPTAEVVTQQLLAAVNRPYDRAADWFVEHYDTDFGEWVDYDGDGTGEFSAATQLRLMSRPPPSQQAEHPAAHPAVSVMECPSTPGAQSESASVSRGVQHTFDELPPALARRVGGRVTAGALRRALCEAVDIDPGCAADAVVLKHDEDFDEWIDIDDEEAIVAGLRLRLQLPDGVGGEGGSTAAAAEGAPFRSVFSPANMTNLPSANAARSRAVHELTLMLAHIEDGLHDMVMEMNGDNVAAAETTTFVTSPSSSVSRGHMTLHSQMDTTVPQGALSPSTSPNHAGGANHAVTQQTLLVESCIPVLTTDEAFAHYERGNGSDVYFVDVRGREEAAQSGVIRGALRCHKGLLEWHTDDTSPLFAPVLLSGKTLILYASGNVTEGGRPEHAAITLVDMGVPNVLVYKEGLSRWKARGYPTAKEASGYAHVRPVVTLRRTARDIILEATKTTQFISVQAARELVSHPDIVFVDVRSMEEINETGVIKGAAIANRELMEWYCDPASQSHHRLFNPLFGSGKKLILYGGGLVGGGRPILASATLRKVLPYHQNVCVLEGGFKAWVAEDLPTEEIETTAACQSLLATSNALKVATFYPRKTPSPHGTTASTASSSAATPAAG